jgi:hypothetical protein
MDISAELADALVESEEDSFTWGGVQFKCNASQVTKGGAFGLDGWGATYDLSITASADQFAGTFPDRQATITYNGADYRIDHRVTAQGGIRLFCVYTSRGV